MITTISRSINFVSCIKKRISILIFTDQCLYISYITQGQSYSRIFFVKIIPVNVEASEYSESAVLYSFAACASQPKLK